MRVRVAAAAAVVLVLVVAMGVLTLGGGGDGLERRWLSETGVPVSGNHHGVAAGASGNGGIVVAPISGQHGTDQCRLVGLAAGDGSVRWERSIPPERCFIHSIGTPALADYDGDGETEVLAGTAERRLLALGTADGREEAAIELSTYGYGRPVAGPILEDGGRAIAVVDARGSVLVARPDGEPAWTSETRSYVWATPAITDVDGDGAPELVVGFGDGFVTAFGRDGTVAWNRSLPDSGALSWLSTGPDEGGAQWVFVGTESGRVFALDGSAGRIAWDRDLGRFAAVGPTLDGDGDGEPEVYATAADGALRSLGAASGRIEWETSLTDGDVQMMPPPAAGDVDGDGAPEFVVAGNDGTVSVVEPADGTVVATYARTKPFWEGGGGIPVWAAATVADTDGDGVEEIYVMYGDGRVLALEYVGD